MVGPEPIRFYVGFEMGIPYFNGRKWNDIRGQQKRYGGYNLIHNWWQDHLVAIEKTTTEDTAKKSCGKVGGTSLANMDG